MNNREEIIKYIDNVNDTFWYQKGASILDYNPILLCQEALEKARSINYTFGIAMSSLSLGMGAFIIQHNAEKSLKILNEVLPIFKDLDNKHWVANTLLTLAIINNSSGKPEAALYYAIKGIEFFEENEGDTQDHIRAFYVIGTVYKDLKKYDEAEKYYKSGIKFSTKSEMWIGRIYTGLSNIYNDRGQYEEALELGLKSLDILKAEKNRIGESRAVNDIGIIYKKIKKYDSALKYLFEALKIREEINMKPFVLGSLLEIAAIYIEIDNKIEAISLFLKAEVLAFETNHQVRLASVYQNLAKLYKQTDNYIPSLEYYEKFIQLTLELNRKERETKINNLESSLIQEKVQEIERLKNVELKNAYDLITEKNKEITDSIHYAHRIQRALLAPEIMFTENLLGNFILFKPKDIVSGDFYWATKVVQPLKFKVESGSELQTSELFYLAVCDSTGHGVPGAFMSLLNSSFFNEAINEKNIYEPHEVLNYVRKRLIESISQDGGQDGMDGILLCFEVPSSPRFDSEQREVEKNGRVKITYAAANNNPVLVRNKTLYELPADKMPVGKGEKTDSFTLHSIEHEKGDVLYLFTDGFPDQFGGPKGKKFKYKQLEQILMASSLLPMDEQRELLDQKFEDWKGDLEQIDDVLLIGIKV